MKSAVFSVRIQLDDDNDPINPVHLCEEIQAYLNSNCSNSEVVGYNLEVERLTPFYAKEVY